MPALDLGQAEPHAVERIGHLVEYLVGVANRIVAGILIQITLHRAGVKNLAQQPFQTSIMRHPNHQLFDRLDRVARQFLELSSADAARLE